MPELQNTFSWSVSAREDFQECRRRRYWSKYAMWNGWQSTAAPLQRAAYRLTKMENRFTIQGNAVERAAMWLLAEHRAGRQPGVEEAYAEIARPYLNRCWSESRNRLWQSNPKRHCCLHEHYYREHHQTPEPEMVARMTDTIKTCLAHFNSALLPRLAQINPAADVPIAAAGAGDPEFFMLDEIKIYAIPDYVCRAGANLEIYDWKSGAPRPSHTDQMAVYGLWAHRKHRQPPENIVIRLEYLAAGKSLQTTLTAADIEKTEQMIRHSTAEMGEYLENADLRRNIPLPCEDWELSADIHICRHCNFYELCKPELEAS